MNINRRKQIKNIISKIEDISNDLAELIEEIESVKNDEEEYLENMPENLQASERGEKAENACSALESAYDNFEEIDGLLSETVESLEEAAE